MQPSRSVSIRAEGGSGWMNSPFSSRRPSSGARASATAASTSGPASAAGLDERDERRRRVLVDLDGRVLLLDRVEVGVRADRRRRGDHADAPGPRRERRRLGARAGSRPGRAGRSGGGTRRGRPRSTCCRRRRAPSRPRATSRSRASVQKRRTSSSGRVAVRRPGVVAEVDRRLAGQPAEDLAEDRQAADARVEDADRARVGHRLSAARRGRAAAPTDEPRPAARRRG